MFRTLKKDKIGNLLHYLSDKAAPLYLTKALKLLYLIDEQSVRQTGVPVTWLDYKVWKLGPVSEEMHTEIQNYHTEDLLAPYIEVVREENAFGESKERFRLLPKGAFDDGEFSDYEMELIDEIIAKYGDKTAARLIEQLHEEGTLWDQVVRREDLQAKFALTGARSNALIDFTDLLEGDELRQGAYRSAVESLSEREEMHSGF